MRAPARLSTEPANCWIPSTRPGLPGPNCGRQWGCGTTHCTITSQEFLIIILAWLTGASLQACRKSPDTGKSPARACRGRCGDCTQPGKVRIAGDETSRFIRRRPSLPTVIDALAGTISDGGHGIVRCHIAAVVFNASQTRYYFRPRDRGWPLLCDIRPNTKCCLVSRIVLVEQDPSRDPWSIAVLRREIRR